MPIPITRTDVAQIERHERRRHARQAAHIRDTRPELNFARTRTIVQLRHVNRCRPMMRESRTPPGGPVTSAREPSSIFRSNNTANSALINYRMICRALCWITSSRLGSAFNCATAGLLFPSYERSDMTLEFGCGVFIGGNRHSQRSASSWRG